MKVKYEVKFSSRKQKNAFIEIAKDTLNIGFQSDETQIELEEAGLIEYHSIPGQRYYYVLSTLGTMIYDLILKDKTQNKLRLKFKIKIK